MANHVITNEAPQELNAQLNLWSYDENGNKYINFDADTEAARQYFLQEVNSSTRFFYSLKEKLEFLFANLYYEPEVWTQYGITLADDGSIVEDDKFERVKDLYRLVYAYKHRFKTYMGALKFNKQYALKSFDGKSYLERYEDRVVATSLLLARGDMDLAVDVARSIMEGRFQPATPTFGNAGKAQRGELVSCFEGHTPVHTESGIRAIKDIRVGERVRTQNGQYNAVLNVDERIETDGFITITIDHDDNKTLECTPEHPVFVYTGADNDGYKSVHTDNLPPHDTKFVWMKAKDIKPMDQVCVLREDGHGYDMCDVINTTFTRRSATVYNLHVANDPTYIASGILVHNCFLSLVNDDMESISKSVSTALQLSKRGGGVALNLSDIRESGAPIKNIEGQSSGVVPVMKILEDSFSYADQLGQRKGSGAVYLSVHHPDIEKFLDTKRENADEKIRIKTLSLGVVITDAMMTAARKGEDLYLFSPYSIMREYGKPLSQISISDHYEEMINNPRIRKSKVSARKLLQRIAEIQFESGYPYVMFEDTVNRANAIDGRVSFSNLCSEILQVSEPATFNDRGEYDYEGRDISCNLGSMNIDNVMKSGQLEYTVDTAIRALTSVSDLSDLRIVPPIRRGNELSHAVGLGQMSLASYFLRMGWQYGSPISLEFTNAYFMAVAYYAYKTSNMIAMERGETFYEFEKSKYADPEYLTQKYSDPANIEFTDEIRDLFREAGIDLPSSDDWAVLAESIAEHGLYNAYLQAVPPTGSISYINNASASIHPFTDAVETRKEGMTGRVYYPQPNVTSENFRLAENAYDVGYKKLIDVYAEATKHVDQGLSLTLFFRDTATTADINKAQLYAYKKGIKTLYYIRLAKSTLSGTEFSECVSCAL